MTIKYSLKEEQWKRIKHRLPGKKGDPGRRGVDNRRFIEAIIGIARNGASWPSLPTAYGKWNSVYKKFSRWAKKGVWKRLFNALSNDADTEWLMIDSTIVRAHQHAAGAVKKMSQ